MTLQVSRHGKKRSVQRIGIPRKAVERNAQKALENGIDHCRAVGALQRYIAMLYNRYDGKGNNIRIYNEFVYVFHNDTLITILCVPPNLRKTALRQQKRGEDNGGTERAETQTWPPAVDGGAESGTP